MEDFVEDCCVETDEDYEFDAPQFYDFTEPEDDSEIQEVERWFQVSGDYPHSPFIVKLNLEKILCPEDVPNSSAIYNVRAKTKPAKTKPAEPRTFTFMEPTASHLAKQYMVHDKNSTFLCTRFQRTSAKLDQRSTRAGFDNLASKRQKLETGYLKKASHLKHQFLLSHKSSKKVTVPREPELETQLRAQRRRSKNSCASTETEKQKQKGCNFKAAPPSKRVLQARPSPQPRKGKPQSSPELHGSQSKTTQRANRHSSAKENRSTGDNNKLPESSLIQELGQVGRDVVQSQTSVEVVRGLKKMSRSLERRRSYGIPF